MSEPSHDTARLLKPTATYRKMWLVLLIGAGLLAMLGWAANSARVGSSPLDDGYELLSLTEGTVSEILVKPGQDVQKGDVLIQLEDSAEQKELADARAELDRVAQDNQSAGIAVAMPPMAGGLGGRIVTTGPMRGIAKGMPPLPKLNDAGKIGTLPPVTGAGESLNNAPTANPKGEAMAHVKDLESQLEAATADAIDRKQKAEDADSEVAESEKNVGASRVIADQRKKQAEKMRSLLAEGVVSQVETSRAEALYASAQGGTEAAERQLEELKANRDARVVDKARAEELIQSLTKQLAATRSAVDKLPSGPASTPQVQIKAPPAPMAGSRFSKPAYVRPEAPPAVPAKVSVDKGAKKEADAQLEAAKLRFDQAEAALESRRIVAPQAGKVLRVLIKIGDRLKPGTSIVSIQFNGLPQR